MIQEVKNVESSSTINTDDKEKQDPATNIFKKMQSDAQNLNNSVNSHLNCLENEKLVRKERLIKITLVGLTSLGISVALLTTGFVIPGIFLLILNPTHWFSMPLAADEHSKYEDVKNEIKMATEILKAIPTEYESKDYKNILTALNEQYANIEKLRNYRLNKEENY